MQHIRPIIGTVGTLVAVLAFQASAGPALPDLRHEEATLASGERIPYASMGAPDAPVVILLDRDGVSSMAVRELMPRLAATHRVLVPELGSLGARSGHPADASRSTAEVLAFMDAAGVAEAVLVGRGAGALLARAAAAGASQRVAAVVERGSVEETSAAVEQLVEARARS